MFYNYQYWRDTGGLKNRLLTTIGYRLDGRTTYALEGSIFVSGAIVQWLRDSMMLISSADETEDIAAAQGGNNGIYMVPALTGLGAPHWAPKCAREYLRYHSQYQPSRFRSCGARVCSLSDQRLTNRNCWRRHQCQRYELTVG